jgi:integrase
MRKGTAKLTVTALRSLLGYLHVAGDIPGPLAWAVPAVATWRLASLPAPLEPGQVTAMLAGCDTGRAAGRRDLAMLTLLARLGLRAGEVAALALHDIDWRAGEITVTGKGRRSERLPLPSDAGEAVAAYLRDGRPEPFEGTRRVFLRTPAPHRGLWSSSLASSCRRTTVPVNVPRMSVSAGIRSDARPSKNQLTSRLSSTWATARASSPWIPRRSVPRRCCRSSSPHSDSQVTPSRSTPCR